jgi:hypothetical protein
MTLKKLQWQLVKKEKGLKKKTLKKGTMVLSLIYKRISIIQLGKKMNGNRIKNKFEQFRKL